MRTAISWVCHRFLVCFVVFHAIGMTDGLSPVVASDFTDQMASRELDLASEFKALVRPDSEANANSAMEVPQHFQMLSMPALSEPALSEPVLSESLPVLPSAETASFSLASHSGSRAAAKPHRNTGFLDFNLYPYTSVDRDNSITINALVNLPNGFQYFGFTNFARDPARGTLEEVSGLLTEQHLRWKPNWQYPVSLAGNVLLQSGSHANDALRFGPRITLDKTSLLRETLERWHVRYSVAFYGAQFDHVDGTQWQIEHAFRWDILPDLLDNRVYIGGFADHNINHATDTNSTWIQEAQRGVRVVGDWYAVIERRYNGYRIGEESSIGVGVEYVMRFK